MKLEEAKLTSKGQITIPKNIRIALGLKTGEKVIFIPENREVIMLPKTKTPLKRLLELRKEIRFSQREIEEMIRESKKEWSKFE
ncbi:MAG: AbrB/MazE/SpoVT family DNA-binding domain-containing protein [Candidatus Omnitrophica bacterium]|nr:AbrB/MazE/SpoVT family DNA-binding domain-containing protein [Candidatus Omnitrophota bacterium]